MRAINYPALDPSVDSSPGSLRASAHSDYGTMTVLRTDGIPGLEVPADSPLPGLVAVTRDADLETGLITSFSRDGNCHTLILARQGAPS